MIRAHRVNATAQDDATLISGWNVAPNVDYILRLLPGIASCGVLLHDAADTLVATGAALAGSEQPCVLTPQTGQTVGMVDAELGWHLLLTTIGTESHREIRINSSVDLPDEIHPIYGDDAMGLARATAAIDEAAHYRDDVSVACPLGLGAGLGDVVSVPVDGVAVVGQVESITWTATPDGATEQAVIRRHVAIAPEAFVEPVLPTVADDTGVATHLTGTSGNVLTNDATGLTVTAVNGLSSNVGVAADGDNGGTFTISPDGSWTFAPDGDFAALSGSETADTSVTYHAGDGTAEAMATLTVTVSHANAAPVAVDDVGATTANATTSGNVLTNDTDADADSLTVTQVSGNAANVGVAVAGSSGGLFTIASNGAWTFDPDGDFDSLTGLDTATTSVTYHASDGTAEAMGTLTVTVSSASQQPWTPAEITTALWLDAADSSTITLNGSTVSQWADKSGNARHAAQGTASLQPTLSPSTLNGLSVLTFSSDEMRLPTDALRTVIGGATQLIDLVVYRVTATNAQGQRIYQHEGTTTGDNGYLTKLVATSSYAISTAVQDGAWQSAAHVTGSGWHLDSAEYIGGTALRAYDFGVLTSADTSVGSAISTPAAGSASVIGATGHATSKRYLFGQIAERVLVVGSVAARQKIEGYLAHKWGLTSLLPSDHPYKAAPPTI